MLVTIAAASLFRSEVVAINRNQHGRRKHEWRVAERRNDAIRVELRSSRLRACWERAQQKRNSKSARHVDSYYRAFRAIMIAMRPCALLLAMASGLFCADIIRWGTVKNDLQLGIAATATSELALRISLKNAGAEGRRITIGFEGSAGPLYNVEITANSPREREQFEVFDLHALREHPTSLPFSISVTLEPGGVQEFRFPLDRLICVVDRRDVPLQTLLRQGYTVRASFEVYGTKVTSPEFSWVIRD